MLNKIILSIFVLLGIGNAQEIEGRWHLVGFEDAIMYQFVDTEPFADAGLRYSIYVDENGEFDDLDGDNIGGTPHPYSVVGDIITIDTHFGNILSYQMNFKCDGQVVEFIDIDYDVIHSILFRENYNYIGSDCYQVQNCCEAEEEAMNNCEGLGCYIPQCNDDCNWEPMQCWSSTGYCWCVDEDGLEIPDTSTPSWQGLPDCEENMDECFDFSDISFGMCDMYLGVGIINDECSYISGCSYEVDGMDYSNMFFDSIGECQENCNSNECEDGFIEMHNLCFHEGDIGVIQLMIDNSYESNIDLDCNDSLFCGSPNPYMDSPENWGWISYDGIGYEMPGNDNGIVEPLELGIQEWENGRLTSFMCGAYIYCQLSGTIPNEIIELTEIETLRLELNYFSGLIPDAVCELDINHSDYLSFDLTGNSLCPPYPECIDDSEESYWYQDTSLCNALGDINGDSILNITDIVQIVQLILNLEYDFYADLNSDGLINVVDVVQLVNLILN